MKSRAATKYLAGALAAFCPLRAKCWQRLDGTDHCRRCGVRLLPKMYNWLHPRGHFVGNSRQRRRLARTACRQVGVQVQTAAALKQADALSHQRTLSRAANLYRPAKLRPTG